MVLESLLELVDTLRKRIDEHGAALRQSEALTRYALIDPLLRELGWDTEDPALVMPEYRLGKGYADYALLGDGKPMIMVEAKKLGTPLQDAASQGIGYCIEDGIAFFAVTDGRQWEIYETHKMAPIAEKVIVQFDLTHSPGVVCLQALALWHPAVEQDSVKAGQTPLVQRAHPEASPIVEVPHPEANFIDATQSAPKASRDNQNWISISEFSPQKEDEAPTELRFPDDNAVQIQNWFMLLTETVRWLYDNRHLTEANPQVRSARSLIVSDSPFHSSGRPFAWPKSIGPLYIEAHGHRYTLTRKLRTVIIRTGQDPAQFKVRLPAQSTPSQRSDPSSAARVNNADGTLSGWQPLSELRPKLHSVPPIEIQFPDGSSTPVGRWNRIVIETVRWLIGKNLLNRAHLPIQQGRRYLLAERPIHSTGTNFHQPKQVNGLYLEASYNADYQVRNANRLINVADQDPTQFKVRF